ncbi:MAG: hypothetical protein IPL75_06520 [Acidobacteria bacterium]|jgi:hypothetical protein|nr:hypothetical protein [Acidobacteriota bacterium]
MTSFFSRTARRLHQPVGAWPRACFLLAAVLIVTAHFFPLWNLTMFAPQYPDALRLDIFDHALVGGNNGQDLKEINLLNHYIGMRDLAIEDFTEFKWMPFALGGLALLLIRAVFFGTMKEFVDAAVISIYFGAFSLWSFGYKMYRYGHDLLPTAAVRVEGFTPPMFGYKKIANFDVYSYPQAGTYLMVAAGLLVTIALVVAWRGQRHRAVEPKDAVAL